MHELTGTLFWITHPVILTRQPCRLDEKVDGWRKSDYYH